MITGRKCRLLALASGSLLVGIACRASTPPAHALSPGANARNFVALFHDSCMVYLGQDQALNATLGNHGFKILPDTAAADYLQGSTGLVWAAPKGVGDFVVALRDDGSCAVFARRIDESAVQSDFDEIARATASPLPVVRQPDRVEDSADGPLNTRSYLQGRPGSTAIQLTLSTTSSATAHQQAVATLSLVDRPAADSEPSTGSP